MQTIDVTSQLTYADLEIRIQAPNGHGYPLELTVKGEQEFEGGTLDSASLPWVSTQDDMADGRNLFEWLFADPTLRAAWHEIRGRLPKRHIHLRIDEGAPELHTIPWELLRDTSVGGNDQPLAASVTTPFARYMAGPTLPGQPITERPVKVLVVIANPANLADYDLPPIDVDAELTALRQVMQNLDVDLRFFPAPCADNQSQGKGQGKGPDKDQGKEQDNADVGDANQAPQACTLAGLADELSNGVHLLHIIAHGYFNQELGQAVLYLADTNNQVVPVTQNEFVEKIKLHLDHSASAEIGALRLIYLAACQSATRSPGAAFRAFAPQLINVGVPTVLAMQDLISQTSATTFGRTFYRQLLRHGIGGLAANEARAALLDANRGDAEVPLLLTRLVGTRLLAPDPIRAILENMQSQRTGFFAEGEEEYLPLPVDVVHLHGQQTLHNLERTEAYLTASSDLMDTVLTIFRRPAWLTNDRPELVLLVGGYGANKSTQVKRIALETVREALAHPGRPPLLPIYVDLKVQHLSRTSTGNPLIDLFTQSLREVWPAVTPTQVEDLLAHGGLKCRILIDHISVLSDWERGGFYDQLYDLIKQYSRNDYLLSTSPILVDQRGSGGSVDLHVLQIQPLTPRKIRHFLQSLSKVGPALLQHFTEKQLFDLTSIPWIMVYLIRRARNGRFPNSRTQTMQDLLNDSITYLPAAQGMRVHAKPLLIRLAWQMQSNRSTTWAVEKVLDMIEAVRGSRGYTPEEFYNQLVEVGLLKPIGEEECAFTHQRMQAFCAALAMQQTDDLRTMLDGILPMLERANTMRWWTQSLIFLSGLIAGETELLEPFLHDLVFSANLLSSEQAFLAARCLMESKRQFKVESRPNARFYRAIGDPASVAEGLSSDGAPMPDPPYIADLQNQVLEALIWRLNSVHEPNAANRARAARTLGQLASPSVVQHLVESAFRPVRRDLRGKYDYDLCSVRMAAAVALLRMKPAERDAQLMAVAKPVAQLFADWEAHAVDALIETLNTDKDEGIRGVAGFALGEIYGQLKAQLIHDPDEQLHALSNFSLDAIIARLQLLEQPVPPTVRKAQQAYDALMDTLLATETPDAVRWAVAHAFTYFDDNEVYTRQLREFVQAQMENSEREISPSLLQQYKCIAYLIGRERLQAKVAQRFLVERCIKATTDPGLWGVAIEALGLLADPVHRYLLEQLATRNFAKLQLTLAVPDESVQEFVQEKAIRALATVGDYHTLSNLRTYLRQNANGQTDWSPALKAAYFETSEEIYWRHRHLCHEDALLPK